MSKSALQNILLLSCSIILALGTGELLLRSFFPKYQYAAESPYELDSLLTWKPSPNSRLIRNHPDTKVSHPVIYNNYGLRQHRNIAQEEIDDSVVISIFGDSYTENWNLPNQYGFTEILDYFLNLDNDHNNHLVMNFGVSGYGTGQEFIKYKTTPLARQSTHVFYILCSNDLGDIYNNGLFSIHDGSFYLHGNDTLVQLSPKKPSRVNLFLQNFYLTYLILDAKSAFQALFRPPPPTRTFDTDQFRANRAKRSQNSIAKKTGQNIWSNNFDQAAQSMNIMNAILDEWRYEVEKNGGVFHIVILPNKAAHNIVAHLSEEVTILDLYEIFTAEFPDYSWGDVTFTNDGHWAKLGNMYAAIAIKQYLQNAEFDLSGNTETYSQLDCYYQAFGNQWRPKNLPQSEKCESSNMVWVRNRYIPLEATVFNTIPNPEVS